MESEPSSGWQMFIHPPGPVGLKLAGMERELRAMTGRTGLLELEDLDSSVRLFIDKYRELHAFVVNVRTDLGNAFLELDQACK